MLAEKEIVLRCLLQLTSEIRPYTPITGQRTDEALKSVVGRETTKNRQEPIGRAERKGKCVQGVPRDICLRQWMKQTLSGMVRAQKRAARYRIFFTAWPQHDCNRDEN